MSLLRLLTTGKSLVGFEEFRASLSCNHPAAVAAVWPDEKSLQQQWEIRTSGDRYAVAGNDGGMGSPGGARERGIARGDTGSAPERGEGSDRVNECGCPPPHRGVAIKGRRASGGMQRQSDWDDWARARQSSEARHPRSRSHPCKGSCP